jgi:hypothetical protein
MSDVNLRRWLKRHWAANDRKRERREMKFEQRYKRLLWHYRAVWLFWALTTVALVWAVSK